MHRSGVEFTNGRMLDRDGSVVQCSHGRRRLEREMPDGTVTGIVSHWGEHRLNSPNDVALAPDGSYWFTDPDYGITQPREGHPGIREYGDCRVFRWSDADGLTPVIDDMDRPNGIAFSPDGRTVYVTDTAGLGDGPGRWIRAYDVEGFGRAVGDYSRGSRSAHRTASRSMSQVACGRPRETASTSSRRRGRISSSFRSPRWSPISASAATTEPSSSSPPLPASTASAPRRGQHSSDLAAPQARQVTRMSERCQPDEPSGAIGARSSICRSPFLLTARTAT